MEKKRIPTTFRTTQEVHGQISRLWREDNCASQNDFIEKAVRFYIGYLQDKEVCATSSTASGAGSCGRSMAAKASAWQSRR